MYAVTKDIITVARVCGCGNIQFFVVLSFALENSYNTGSIRMFCYSVNKMYNMYMTFSGMMFFRLELIIIFHK